MSRSNKKQVIDAKRRIQPRRPRRKDLLRRARKNAVATSRVKIAAQSVNTSDELSDIAAELTSTVGCPRVLPWRPFFGLLILHALTNKASMSMVDITLTGLCLTEKQRNILGLPEKLDYHHVEGNLTDLSRALAPQLDTNTGELKPARLRHDHDEVVTLVLQAELPKFLHPVGSVALDATDIASYYQIRFPNADLTSDISPDAPVPDSVGKGSASKTKMRRRDVPLGEDGRCQYTADPDARAGYRTAKQGTRPLLVGYLPTVVANVPDIGAKPTPPVARAIYMTPAGTSPGDSGLRAIDLLPALPSTAINDNAYNYSHTYGKGLISRGISPVVDLHQNFRGVKPGPRDRIIVIDQDFFTDAVPEKIRKLNKKTPRMSQTEALELAKRYDERARYAFTPQGHPHPKTRAQRFRGPALTGRVRCVNTPQSLKLAPGPNRPTTSCLPGDGCTCGTTFVATLDEYGRNHRRELYGTTA